MEGKQYLKKGDITKLAEMMSVSSNHMALVIRGKRKNDRLEQAAKTMIQKRIHELESIQKVIENAD